MLKLRHRSICLPWILLGFGLNLVLSATDQQLVVCTSFDETIDEKVEENDGEDNELHGCHSHDSDSTPALLETHLPLYYDGDWNLAVRRLLHNRAPPWRS